MHIDDLDPLAVDDHRHASAAEIRGLVRTLRMRGVDQAARAEGKP
jgi:hypothetical protein